VAVIINELIGNEKQMREDLKEKQELIA